MDPPVLARPLHEKEVSMESIDSVEDVDTIVEEKSVTTIDDRYRKSAHGMSLRPRIPLSNAHRNTFEQNFQHL